MSRTTHQPDANGHSVEFHLLGKLDFDQSLALQQRLAYEVGGRDDGQIQVLFCEHANLITVGRRGSRAHIRLTDEELARRQLETRWVSRRGGCLLHAPGQLAIYPLVPLNWHRWTVKDFLRRFQTAIVQALDELRIRTDVPPGQLSIWGRSGCLAAFGVSVRNGVTRHGAFLNVHPPMMDFGFVDVVGREIKLDGRKATMSCLLAERRRPVKMTDVRSLLIPKLAAAFGTDRYHLHTGHPLLRTETLSA